MGWGTTTANIVSEEWLKDALCRGINTRLFFAENGDIHTQRQAVTFCNGTLTETIDPRSGLSVTTGEPGCPVRLECLDYALSFPQDLDNYGVYGGTLPSQRVTIRTANRKSRSEADNKYSQDLAQLLNIIHDAMVVEGVRSQASRMEAYKDRIERRQD